MKEVLVRERLIFRKRKIEKNETVSGIAKLVTKKNYCIRETDREII